MATIRDEIEAWARTNIQGANAITKNDEAYNHMQQAVQELLERPWANLVIGADLAPPPVKQTATEPTT